MDRFDQRARSRGSRDVILDDTSKEEFPSDQKEIQNSGSFDNNLHQYIKRNSNSLAHQPQQFHNLGEDSDLKEQTSYDNNEQIDIYQQISPSPMKDTYEGEEDLSDRLEDVNSAIKDSQFNQADLQQIQQPFYGNQDNQEIRGRQKTGSFNAQQNRNSACIDEGTPISSYLESEQQTQGEVRRRQSSNYHNQQQRQQDHMNANIYNQHPNFGNNTVEREDLPQQQQEQGGVKKQLFDDSYFNQKEKEQRGSLSQNNECNIDDLIIDEGNQQAYDSKDQSYDYSKGSSPEKNLKESTNSGVQNFNSYQQKHRLLQKRSNDSLSVQEQQQQQQPMVDNPQAVQAIKYVPYQPPQQLQPQVQKSLTDYQSRDSFGATNTYKNIYTQEQDMSPSYEDSMIRNQFQNEFNRSRKQGGNNDNSRVDQQNPEKLVAAFSNNVNNNSMNRGSFNAQPQRTLEDKKMIDGDSIGEYQERLREKDQMLEQMKSFTTQLQQALEKQQDHVISLKKENVGLRQQVRENLQIQGGSASKNPSQKFDQEISGEQEYELLEENMVMSIPPRSKSYEPKPLRGANQAIRVEQNEEEERALRQKQEQDEIENIKQRFFEMQKSTDTLVKNNPIEDELYRQIDNLNEIIDKLRKDNMTLHEDNRGLIQDSHRIVQDQKDIKYKLTNEIEILALQNRKLLQSHKLQQDNYDYTSRIHELNYKLEILKQENEELSRVNSDQLEDIKILLQEKDKLTLQVKDLDNQLEQRGSETSRKYEQLKFDLAKEYESKLNLKVQDIHYKSHVQIQELKNKLKQQQPNYPNNYNSLNPSSTINSNNYQNFNQLNPYNNNGKQTLTKQSNVQSTPNIHNYQGQSTISNNNPNNIKSVNNLYNENNNFLNDPQSNIYSQHQLNNTYNASEWNHNKQQPVNMQNQPISRSSSNQEMIEKRIVWEICGILRNEQIEILPRIIADMKDLNKNLTKFSDCIIQMVAACHPKDYFAKINPGGINLPTLKQSWKWLKQIMEDYMHLKSQPSNAFEQQICQMLQVQHKIDAASILGDKLLECTIANRVFKKISHILDLKSFNTFSEFELLIDQLEKEDANMVSPDKYNY